jgi:hypothetical protein
MRSALLLLASAGLSILPPASAAPPGKPEETKALLRIITELEELASRQTSQSPTGASAAQIERLLDRADSIGQLTRLALMSHTIASPQSATDVAYDSVFDYTLWQCARRIARQPGPDAAAALQQLQPILGADGRPSLTMKELIESQKKLVSRP